MTVVDQVSNSAEFDEDNNVLINIVAAIACGIIIMLYFRCKTTLPAKMRASHTSKLEGTTILYGWQLLIPTPVKETDSFSLFKL